MAVNPAGVSQIGQALGNHATDTGRVLHGAQEAMHKGRGFSAPGIASTNHHSGSQGKHR